jgi:hypothetical protein
VGILSQPHSDICCCCFPVIVTASAIVHRSRPEPACARFAPLATATSRARRAGSTRTRSGMPAAGESQSKGQRVRESESREFNYCPPHQMAALYGNQSCIAQHMLVRPPDCLHSHFLWFDRSAIRPSARPAATTVPSTDRSRSRPPSCVCCASWSSIASIFRSSSGTAPTTGSPNSSAFWVRRDEGKAGRSRGNSRPPNQRANIFCNPSCL